VFADDTNSVCRPGIGPSVLDGRASPLLLALVLLLNAQFLPGCRQEPEPLISPNVVARIDNRLLEIADVEAEIAARAPGYRAQQFAAPDKREELLDSMVQFQLLAAEAERRGYARDPKVVRAAQQEMVAILLRREIDEQLHATDVSDADVEKRYRERAAEFEVPEQVRVSQIMVGDMAKARKVVSLARAARRTDATEDGEAFRELVLRFSEDASTRARGGELGTLTRRSTGHAPALLDTALSLKQAGEVSNPINGPRGFHILKLIEHKPASIRPLEEVRTLVAQELLGQRRTRKIEELVSLLRARSRTDVYKEALAKVRIPDRPEQ
jgi:peptidyl-prolyl cis-trans isomerase C